MPNLTLIFCLLLFSRGVPDIAPTPIDEKHYDDFKLTYMSAGLGSGMGSMQPTFRVTALNYIYTYEQNSYYGKPNELPDTICTGTLRMSSIDSIIGLVRDIKDTVVYRTTLGVISGGIQQISIAYNSIDLTFKLHNASESTAQKIVDILNSNIPEGQKKLWLFSLPIKDE